MSSKKMQWSFYAILISFAIFFASLNIYIMTSLLDHPWKSHLWIIGVIIGLAMLIYSIYIMRIHQKQMISSKQEKET
ncbi:hypothetical protein EU527_17500 [Candidatus Thorarchaeota archaeon]|nr:MAG: hypothetical protein EU527_17500 [Candidatus Thorarchaeota archaeon]